MRATLTDWDLSRDGAPQFEAVPERPVLGDRVGPHRAARDGHRAGEVQAMVRFSLAVPPGVAAGGLSHRHSVRVRRRPPATRSRARARCSSRAASRR